MKIGIKNITNVINKISDMTSGDKIIPGVMLEVTDDKLKIYYSDGHKSLVEELNADVEETDLHDKVVVSYEAISRAIANCQPVGSIQAETVQFTFKDNNIITVSSSRNYNRVDENGNIVESRKLGDKHMDLVWAAPDTDVKTKILTRMNYDEIFTASDITDTYNKKELIEALTKTSAEKSRQIYISGKTQSVFVTNQAHVTAVPISGYSVDQEQLDTLRGTLVENGTYTEELYEQEAKKLSDRIHFSVTLAQSKVKSIIGVLNKTASDEVQLYTNDRFCNIFIDNDTEKMGLWFEMDQPSKAHVGTLERYNALKYEAYQINFMRDFLDDIIKSAMNATKSEKVAMKFQDVDGVLSLVIASGSSSASIADTYSVACDNVVDLTSDLKTKQFNISLKVLYDMLSQLKTECITMDFDIGVDGTASLRLAELDYASAQSEYMKARELTKQMCEQQGLVFDPNTTPTPLELKTGYRTKTLLTKQYTMIAK